MLELLKDKPHDCLHDLETGKCLKCKYLLDYQDHYWCSFFKCRPLEAHDKLQYVKEGIEK